MTIYTLKIIIKIYKLIKKIKNKKNKVIYRKIWVVKNKLTINIY